MTQTYFPFDAGAGANITESQWQQMAKFFFGTGPIKSQLNEFLVYADSTGMQCKVKSGIAWIQGHFFQSDAEVVMPIATAPSSNSRIDRVILRVDWTANTVTINVLQGTVAASPTPPALTQNNAKWEISLAQVLVGTSVATIAAGNITDERVFAGNDYNFQVNYFGLIPVDSNSSGDIFPIGVLVGSLPAGAVNYPAGFGTLVNFRTSNVRHSQLFFGTGNGAGNTIAPYYRMWYNGTWTAWQQLYSNDALIPFFRLNVGSAPYSTASTDQLITFTSAQVPISNGFTVGTNIITFNVAGTYRIHAALQLSGLNSNILATVKYNVNSGGLVGYFRTVRGATGWDGANGGGVWLDIDDVVTVIAGATIQFYANIGEAPRTIMALLVNAERISA